MEKEKAFGWQERTGVLLGAEAVEQLGKSRVCVFGLGAVGSYAVEGLARAGVGWMRLVDFDTIKESNINRQLYALHSTIGRNKAELAAERVLDINPGARVDSRAEFVHEDTLPALLDDGPDLIIDAIDSLNPKAAVIAAATDRGLPVFSALGAATRMDAAKIRFGPLFSARGCPLGRQLRKRLRRRGVEGDCWCVYSDEEKNPGAVRPPRSEEGDFKRGRERNTLGSLPTLTGLFGLRLAHEAVLRLAGRGAP